MEWSTACPDWERRVVAGQSLVPFAPLFPAEANSALGYFRDLTLLDVAGSPTVGEACRQWVFDFAGAIFGAYDAETGRRLIREFLLLVSKKNSKSTIAAAIMLTALLRNWRKSAEFLILAPQIEVANNAFGPARDMIKANDELANLLYVQEHYRMITHQTTGATLKVVAADNEAVGGKKAVGVLVDELWLFGKRANAENMLREATGGLASRPEGFVIYLSTQSDDPPAGVFKQKLDYFRGVRDGRIVDPRSLGVLYEFPERMIASGECRLKSNFYVTNPNLGKSVDAEFLEREMDKAVEAGEGSVRGFLAKHLNVEIGLALRSDRWVGADRWESRAKVVTLDTILKRSEVIVIGIDGGGMDDLLSMCVLGRVPGAAEADGRADRREWLIWTHSWVSVDMLDLRKSEAPRLRDFEKAGDLTIVDVPGDDIVELVDIIERVAESGLLASENGIGLDPMGIGQIVDEIAQRQLDPDGKRVVGVSQGWKLSGAIKTAERKLFDGTMTHGGQAINAWAVGNAKVEPKGNAVTITKQTSGTGKIDPLMATFDAVALMSMNPESCRSPYEERGLLII